jgi:hypothetical protein
MMKKKSILCLFLIILLVCSAVALLEFGRAQLGTEVNGIIKADTTWTKANSPYSLTGPVAILDGVTLTIESGVTVNLNSHYILVNGTLQARGNNAEFITINGDPQVPNNGITFAISSTNWNQQAGSGCVIEDAILNSVAISISKSAKVNNNTINGGYIDAEVNASPIITNNKITGGLPSQTAISAGGSAIVSNNVIISSHNIAILSYNSATVFNNVINGNREKGINANGIGGSVLNNAVTNCSQWGIRVGSEVKVENNIVMDNYEGIVIAGNSNIIINNSIRNSAIAIYAYSPAIIVNNNIEDTTQYLIRLDITEKYPINATYNYWGITDQQAIDKKIYDFKDDFNLGSVTFIPFLLQPYSQSPYSTSTSNPTSSVPEFSPMIALGCVLLVTAVFVAVLESKRGFVF